MREFLSNTSEAKKCFDFEKWFQQRCSRHTSAGGKRRPGTFTITEDDLLRNLV